jgi:hypothetical protein
VAPVFPSTLDVETGLEPFNETVALDAVTRSVLSVVDVPFSLVPQSDAADMVTRSLFVGAEIVLARVPASALTFAAFAPAVYASAGAVVPARSLTLAALAPAAVTGSGFVSVPVTALTVTALVPTVSVELSDPDFASVSLLLHMNGTNGSTTFTDTSTNAFTVTASGGAQISTAQSRFGGASGIFDGTNDRLSAPVDADLQLSGDFTIEWWIYLTNLARNNAVFAATSTNCWFSFHPGGVRFVANGSFRWLDATPSTAVAVNTWTHVALVRSGTTLKLYVSGDDSLTITSFSTRVDLTFVGVGSGGVNDYMLGYLDEMRVTNGVARYTSNFTPPTTAFPDA